MARRKQAESGGIPEWMCTYGDMMSLLLCFFIMLFAMSIITPIKWEAMVEWTNMKMGYSGHSKVPSQDNKPSAALSATSEMSRRTAALTGGQPTVGPAGDHTTLQSIQPDSDRVKGGLIRFELGSAELNEQAEKDLKALLQVLTSSTSKIFVEGYAAPAEEGESIYSRGVYLAQNRAKNVMDYLISLGLKKEFFEMSTSSTIPNKAVLPRNVEPKYAGASAAVYLLLQKPRPIIAPANGIPAP